VQRATIVVYRPQQEPMWLSSSAAPIRSSRGEIVGAVATAADITALHALQERTLRLREAERRAREQAEAAVRARDEFLSAAAHELKTPVTTLRGYAQLTGRRLQADGVLDPRQVRQAMCAIDRQSDRLARLVAQLLDTADFEAGRVALQRQPTDVAALARDVVAGAQAGTETHTITLKAPPTLEAVVDPQRLARVLASLLDNAIRFSPKGTPIQVDLRAQGPETLRLTVRDHGPGIAPERRERLFSRFYQAQTGRPFAGLGLGLYLARRVGALHGGHIAAEFPHDGGTRIVIELPRR